jgi:solute carrier family 25 (mitochondrial carnitine/acylcarnitine transporter), member 20/29
MKFSFAIIVLLGTALTLNSALNNLGCRTRSSCMRQIYEPAMMMDVLSITAGSVAGAVGVGFAYPLDSMKTKIQNIAASQSSEALEKYPLDLLLVAQNILKDEGIWSLYKGVAGVMMGNALIKACAFSANRWALSEFTTGSPTLDQLCMSAAFAGMVTSFFSNPIERVKVLMQSEAKVATGGDLSELDVITQVLKSDGLHGLAFRGLDATLAREIPGYSLYFVGYFTLMHGPLGEGLGPFGPVVIGALAGMLSWLIVFPLDVCKT